VLLLLLFVAASFFCLSVSEKIISMDHPQGSSMIGNIISRVLSPHCYQALFVEHEFEIACIKLVISKLLGYLIILGSVFLKVPQILQIMKAKSVEGISFMMYYLEVAVYTITVAYSFNKQFPFSAYGDSVFVLIQDFVIVYLLFMYSGRINVAFIAVSSVYFIALSVLLGGIVDINILSLMQGATIPLGIISRVPQIWKNYSEGGVGNLNIITFFLNFAGALARVFTTLQELDDILFLIAYSSSTILNGTITAQIIYYNYINPKPKPTTNEKKAAKKSQ